MTSERQTVIYTAARPQQAQLLKNLLADARIEAVLLNDALQSAVGEVPFGWATAVRVAVRESDAAEARALAVQFDRRLASGELAGADVGENEATEYETVDEATSLAARWPTCPSCQQARQTTCPICQTSGSDFEIGEGGGSDEESDATAENPLAIISVTGRMLVICPTCDEPFVPRYLRRCEWCNYNFGEGTQLPPRRFSDVDLEINARALFLLAVLAVLLGSLLLWFGSLLRIE